MIINERPLTVDLSCTTLGYLVSLWSNNRIINSPLYIARIVGPDSDWMAEWLWRETCTSCRPTVMGSNPSQVNDWSCTFLIAWALELAHLSMILLYFLFEKAVCERSSDDNHAHPLSNHPACRARIYEKKLAFPSEKLAKNLLVRTNFNFSEKF